LPDVGPAIRSGGALEARHRTAEVMGTTLSINFMPNGQRKMSVLEEGALVTSIRHPEHPIPEEIDATFAALEYEP
jgi:hypothetical protein